MARAEALGHGGENAARHGARGCPPHLARLDGRAARRGLNCAAVHRAGARVVVAAGGAAALLTSGDVTDLVWARAARPRLLAGCDRRARPARDRLLHGRRRRGRRRARSASCRRRREPLGATGSGSSPLAAAAPAHRAAPHLLGRRLAGRDGRRPRARRRRADSSAPSVLRRAPPAAERDIAALDVRRDAQRGWPRPGARCVGWGPPRRAPSTSRPPPGVRNAERPASPRRTTAQSRLAGASSLPRRHAVEDYGIAQLEALADGCVLATDRRARPYAALPLARALDQRFVPDDTGGLAAALRRSTGRRTTTPSARLPRWRRSATPRLTGPWRRSCSRVLSPTAAD